MATKLCTRVFVALSLLLGHSSQHNLATVLLSVIQNRWTKIIRDIFASFVTWCGVVKESRVNIKRSFVKFRIFWSYALILRNWTCLPIFFLESRGMLGTFWWDLEEGIVEVMDMASVSQWRLCSWLVAMSPASLWMKTKGMKNAHISSEPSTNTEDSGDDAVRINF